MFEMYVFSIPIYLKLYTNFLAKTLKWVEMFKKPQSRIHDPIKWAFELLLVLAGVLEDDRDQLYWTDGSRKVMC